MSTEKEECNIKFCIHDYKKLIFAIQDLKEVIKRIEECLDKAQVPKEGA